nr:MAG TPA: Protein of unknown function (DUF2778) [Crassvirales sp.]
MKLLLERKWKKPNYTIGILYIDGNRFCEAIEDTDRGINNSMTEAEILRIKKPNITAIPTGVYPIDLNTVSSRFGKVPFYVSVCKGKLPRLQNVKGYSGVLIHCGNTEKDSSGCIICGENKVKGKVINSKETFKRLYKLLQDSYNRGEKITIEIR